MCHFSTSATERLYGMNNEPGRIPADSRTCGTTESIGEKKHFRFEKCIGCPDMGPECLGPNLLMMPIAELRAWVKKWKEYYHISGDQCAIIWNTPVGTVSRFLATQETDFKYTTVQGIIRGIVYYGYPPDRQFGDNPCPATSSEIHAQVSGLEKQLDEKREECERLSIRKQEHSNEYIERMAEQRENYEKHLADREDTVRYLRDLADKRQRDLEKSEAVSRNYLDRIDVKNRQIEERDAEIRRLTTELLRISASHSEEIKGFIDRILRMSDLHAAEIKALAHIGK